MKSFTESIIEQAAIYWLQELGYEYAFSPEIALDGVVRVVRLRNWMELSVLGREEVEVKA